MLDTLQEAVATLKHSSSSHAKLQEEIATLKQSPSSSSLAELQEDIVTLKQSSSSFHTKCVALEEKLLYVGESIISRENVTFDKLSCNSRLILNFEEQLQDATAPIATSADKIRKLQQGMCELEEP